MNSVAFTYTVSEKEVTVFSVHNFNKLRQGFEIFDTNNPDDQLYQIRRKVGYK